MSSELIFVTEATGFIGAATALAALQAVQVEKLKDIFSDYANKIEFVIVPDITADGAFAKVLNGVDYILHLASPLARSTDPKQIFPPAIEGTVGILRDAAKVPSIKKVVITSSIAALVPLNGPPEGEVVRGKSLSPRT